jgi:hypothetical protein
MCCEVNRMAGMYFSWAISLSLGKLSMVVFRIMESRKAGLSSIVAAPSLLLVVFTLIHGRKTEAGSKK